MWKFVLAFPVMMHGLAHVSGFLASWTGLEVGYKNSPWLLSSGIYLRSPIGRLFGILWLISAILYIATAMGLVFTAGWWPMTALTAAGVSLTVILPWLNTVPPGAWLGAAFDLLVLLTLLTGLKEKLLTLLT